MKQYILGLRSNDFIRSGKSWTTDAIDLYHNKFYTNYSVLKSRTGINTIGDRTFVGTEVLQGATPSVVVEGSTPIAVTNYGEIIRDPNVIRYNIFQYDELSGEYYIFDLIADSSPYYVLNPESVDLNLERFVDTSSRVDILSYRSAFTNVQTQDVPTHQIKVYEADSAAGPWLLSSVSSQIGTLFISNTKRYVKFEIEVTSELDPEDVENYGLVVLVEVAIANAVSPVLTKMGKNILRRFPSWMEMYEDSLDQATPELSTPNTIGGAFINALVSDYPENFEKQVNLFELDKNINTSDINQLAWIYTTSSVLPSHMAVTGDDITLSKVDSIVELYESAQNDYVYYYNSITREILTIKLFQYLAVDSVIGEQTPVLKWNWFDEFGVRVGINRLYLESNSNFKNRILDVYINRPGTTLEATKLTLRRELDTWSAFGATPDSNHLGATPEIIEIVDMESSTPYFTESGQVKKEFKDFVEKINTRYPTNWGYANWQKSYWDYAGALQEGVGRISANYDGATPLGDYYQPGVGDFEDAKIIVKEPIESNIDFSARFKAYGIEKDGFRSEYSPVKVDYEYYGSYYQDIYENQSATANFKYVLELNAHGSYTQKKSFYTDVAFYPQNSYEPGHPASPEYSTIRLFDAEGYNLDGYVFRNLSNNEVYLDTASTPSQSKVNVHFASKASATPSSGSSNFNIKLFGATPISKSIGSPVSLATPNQGSNSANIQVSSDLYNKTKQYLYTSPKIPGSFTLNDINHNTTTKDHVLNKDFIKKNLIFPPGATPVYIHIDNVKPVGYDDYLVNVYSTPTYDGYGGFSRNENLDLDYLIPASPNIIAQYVVPNFATPDQHFGYINTSGSTVNYYFKSLKFPYASTPDQINFKTNSSIVYPFQVQKWTSFEETTEPLIDGTVSQFGIIRTDPDNKDDNFSKNSDLIGIYNLTYADFDTTNTDRIIQKIEVVNDIDGVDLFMDRQYVYPVTQENVFLDNVIRANEDGSFTEISVRAKYNGNYKSYIKTGWYSQNEEDYYVYSNPITEHHTTPGFELELNDVSRQGAPIIVSGAVVNNNVATPFSLQEVAFYDEATPTQASLTNKEVIYANKSNKLFLGYDEVYNVSVTDLVTGYTILTNGQAATPGITVFSSATPVVYQRPYEVTYKVPRSFAVDNDYYDSVNEKYISRIYFDSTPSASYSYDITYESSLMESSTPISLVVDPNKLWDQEGFVYLSHNDYGFGSIKAALKPSTILDNNDDFMTLTINSLDVNDNSKPYQSFRITASTPATVTSEQEYVTTDINGFAYVNLYYSGSIPAATPSGTVLINGLSLNNVHAHENSSTSLMSSKVLNYSISTNYSNQKDIKAIADTSVLYANGISTNYIRGIIKDSGVAESGMVILWKKARTLEELFSQNFNNTQYVISDEDGKFSIGPIQVMGPDNPGIWFVSVESEHQTFAQWNQTSIPETISVDIVYLYEKYDNINYTSQDSVLYHPNVLLGETTDIYSYPAYPVNYYDGSPATPTSATVLNWNLPTWYPVDRWQQYQMHLLTNVSDQIIYTNLMNDHEEE